MDKNGDYAVYLLNDPRDGIVRYVGISNDVNNRFISHLKYDYKNNKHKWAWVQELKVIGLKPLLTVVKDNISRNEAVILEKELINKYKNIGLFNISPGGVYPHNLYDKIISLPTHIFLNNFCRGAYDFKRKRDESKWKKALRRLENVVHRFAETKTLL